jgi:hypothetical protein
LLFAFSQNREWTKEEVSTLSNKTGLTESQVYKWAWDQKKKFTDPDHSQAASEAKVSRDEFGGYCKKRWEHEDMHLEEDLCKLLGIDIESKALAIARNDTSKRGFPVGLMAFNTPHAALK